MQIRRKEGQLVAGETGQERPPLVPLHVTQAYNIFTHTRTRTRTRTPQLCTPLFQLSRFSFFLNDCLVAFVTQGCRSEADTFTVTCLPSSVTE
jgi:hypothetical protein